MSFFINSQVTLRGEFTINGGAIAVAPRLTTLSPLTKVKTLYVDCTGGGGRYERVITPTEAGLWQYAFEDLNTGAYQNGTFEVVPRPV